MPLVSARVISLITPDTVIGFADAGEDQSVLCASVVQLQGEILGDDPANHTFEWEQTFGTPVTLVNPNTLFPSFVNPLLSDLEFTLYVDRNTPFETSDTVFISRRPASTTSGGVYPSTVGARSNSNGAAAVFQAGTSAASMQGGNTTDVDFRTAAYPYNYPPDHTYSPIYKADDLQRINNNLGGKYWLMKDIDMSELSKPWVPIGNRQTRPFFGELQGNGFTISNLTVVGDGTANIGLFGHASQGAVIEGVAVTNASVSGAGSAWYDAILVGSAIGPTNFDLDGGPLTIRNCYVEGTVDSGGDRAGGLIGYTGTNVSTTIENTYSDATVTGGGIRTGGWVGFFETEITANDNFWNSDKTAAGYGSAGDTPLAGELDARTTAQLQVQSNYTNWDFDTIWQMPELKDNIGPAQLQNNLANRVASAGACLSPTTSRQGATWKRVQTRNNDFTGSAQFTNLKMIGAIVQDQNPTTLAWENTRFFPVEHTAALMTPGRRHRMFTVLGQGPVSTLFGKAPLREVAYLVPNTVVPKEAAEDSSVFAGGTSPANSIYPSTAGASSIAAITITNPKKISNLTLDTVVFYSPSEDGSTNTVSLARYVGATFPSNGLSEPESLILHGGPGPEGPYSSVSITRNNGASIGT